MRNGSSLPDGCWRRTGANAAFARSLADCAALFQGDEEDTKNAYVQLVLRLRQRQTHRGGQGPTAKAPNASKGLKGKGKEPTAPNASKGLKGKGKGKGKGPKGPKG
eukprot:SAG11_NODE_1123_length_5778_cov_4.474027_2_plen_106_part_00